MISDASFQNDAADNQPIQHIHFKFHRDNPISYKMKLLHQLPHKTFFRLQLQFIK
jgi:hypothetical protein